MRVVMFVSNDVVHDSRVIREARALQTAGHDVRLVGWDRTGQSPERREWDGFDIRYVRTRGLLRTLGTDVLRNPMWWRAAYRLALREAFDVVHCHDLDTLPIGVRLKRRTGCFLVYDAHEVFGYMIEEDVPSFVTNAAFRMERRLAPLADRVIAVNPAVQSYIDGVTGHRSVLVRNTEETVLEAYRPPPESPFTVLYVGTLHKSRFVLESIDAVAELPDVRLVLGGSKALTEVVKQRCALHPNTQFVGLVPRERVMPMTVESHAVLSMFDPRLRINQVGFPNKIYEAMAAGRPSIVSEGLPMSDLVEHEACGFSVPYSLEGFRRAVTLLRDDPALAERLGRNGLAAAKREYNWASEGRRLIRLYEELGAESASPRGRP